MTADQPVRPHFSLAGLVWVVCGLILLAAKVGFYASSASAYWEYLGGFMILFGLVRLFWELVKGPRKTKPGFWYRIV
jgi:hypothetical protein